MELLIPFRVHIQSDHLSSLQKANGLYFQDFFPLFVEKTSHEPKTRFFQESFRNKKHPENLKKRFSFSPQKLYFNTIYTTYYIFSQKYLFQLEFSINSVKLVFPKLSSHKEA